MKKCTTDKDLYGDLDYMNDPERWEREQARREKEYRREKRLRRKKFLKDVAVKHLKRAYWTIFTLGASGLAVWLWKKIFQD